MSLELSIEDFITVVRVRSGEHNWFVARPSPLENPFRMESERDRWDVVEKFEVHFNKAIADNDPVIMRELWSMMDYLRLGIHLKLGCHCAPKRCHADIIKKRLIFMYSMIPKTPVFKHSRHSGYEVSSKGDARFSAFNALMEDGRSIEMHYQCDVKEYDPGGTDWRKGKGKPPLSFYKTPDMLYCEYLRLWRNWAFRNEDLMAELRIKAGEHENVLRDSFASSNVNQARALAQLLTERYPQG